jgi:cell division protein FtsA
VLPEDRREGVVLIDIGTHSTEMVCYYGDAAQASASLRLCGDHFTRDLAHALRVPYEAAQIVKHEFGGTIPTGVPLNSMVELPIADRAVAEERAPREAARLQINQILEARAVELFELVREELARVGMQRAIASGVVVAGGGALLPGICDIAERVLDCPARLGLAQGFLDWPDELNDPSWTTVAGLSMYCARLRSQVDLERQSVGLLGRILR